MKRIFSRAGSVKLAMVLMVFFAIIMGWATFIERRFGTPVAWWLVYGSPLFVSLIALLGVNILAAVLARFPWNRNLIPFLLAHGGILVLLAGCLATFLAGQQGKMTITEGCDGDTIVVHDSWEFNLTLPTTTQETSETTSTDKTAEDRVTRIPFNAGPLNWSRLVLESGPAASAKESSSSIFSLPARFMELVNLSAIRGLIKVRQFGQNRSVYNADGLRIDAIDYLTCADFDRVGPLEIEWRSDESPSSEAASDVDTNASEVDTNIENESGKTVRVQLAEDSADPVEISRSGMRSRLEDGRRVSFRLADSYEEFKAFLDTVPETPETPSVMLAIHGEVYQFSFEELRELQGQKPAPVALGSTGCHVVSFRLVPTLLGESEHLQGWTALLSVKGPKGQVEEMQLHSELSERNQQANSLGVYGALWYAGQNEDDTPKVGRRQDPELARDRLELIQSPAGHLACRYVRNGKPLQWGVWYQPEFVPAVHSDASVSTALLTPIPQKTVGAQPVWSTDWTETDFVDVTGHNTEEKKVAEHVSPFRITRFTPHDELGWRLVPRPFNKDQANEFYGKVRMRVRDEQGTDEVFWLRTIPSDAMSETQQDWFTKKVNTSRGTLAIALVNQEINPGFKLHLSRFSAFTEPGSSTPSAFISQVDYLPKSSNTPSQKDVIIQMNRPGHFTDPESGNKWWVYQDSWRGPYHPGDEVFDRTAGGQLLPGETTAREEIAQTVLSFNSDPGRLGKYPGSFLIVLGTWLLIRRRRGKTVHARTITTSLVFALLVLTGSVYADSASEEVTKDTAVVTSGPGPASPAASPKIPRDRFDWSTWRSLPVFSDGRIMPNSVFAAILVRDICGSTRPVLSLDPELLRRMDGPIPLALPSFEEFIADLPPDMKQGDRLTEARKAELQSWYDKVAGEQLIRQKNAANRLRALFPNLKRRFAPEVLLFSWLVEPEVWEYVPFLSEDSGLVAANLKYNAAAVGNRFAPVTLDSHKEYTQRIDRLFAREPQTFSSREEATAEARRDFAFGRLEQRYSQYRALTWLPEKSASPLVEYYLSQLLFGDRQSEAAPVLMQLDQAIREIVRLLPMENKDRVKSPFDDSEFILRKTTEMSESGDKSESSPKMLLLAREINLIAKAYRSYPLRVQGRMLSRLCDETQSCLAMLRIHRDEVFQGDVYSRDYKNLLQRIIYFMDEVSFQATNAATALTDGGYYRCIRVEEKDRIATKSETETSSGPHDMEHSQANVANTTLLSGPVTGTPGAHLSFPSRHELCLVPAIREMPGVGTEAMNPWLSIKMILFAPDDIYDRFIDPNTLTPEEKQKSFSLTDPEDQVSTTATAVELMTRRAGQVTESHPLRAFSEAATAWVSEETPDTYERFNGAMVQFSESLRRAAQAGEPVRGTLVALARNQNAGSTETASHFDKTNYPERGQLDAELFYQRLDAFYWMWFFCMLALFSLIPARILDFWSARHNRSSRIASGLAILGLIFLLISCFVTILGAGVRAWITGWAPVTNMFETVVLLGLFISLISIAYVLWPVIRRDSDQRRTLVESLRHRFGVLTAGTTAALLIGLLAYYNSTEFNPQIRPLVAVLRSNFWLTVHVLAIIVSYALGTIAWFISLVVLGRVILFGERFVETETTETTRTLLTVLVRYIVLFLTAGIILGGLWADFSWGRFWSWDPKEVWALVTLMIYLVVLHARRSGHNGLFSLAAGSALGALAIVMTWYGLSFVFGGGGRHAYTGGESTKTGILLVLLIVNIAWVVMASIRRKHKSVK